MNGPFVVAQANSASSGATPVQVIKLFKPTAGHTEIFHASFSGVVKIDFSAIANEKITLFHDSKNQSLHIIFADGSQDIIEPFFDSRGIMSNLLLDMGSGQEFNGERFASQFPITEDQSVLPAAGPGGVASGADFHGPFVDGLFTGNPLDLLPPEELPGLQFTITEAPTFLEETLLEEVNLIPAVSGHLFGVVEEEALNRQVEIDFSDSGPGNEDTHDAAGNDHDTSQFGPGSQITTQKFSGALAGLVTGGDLPITFLVNNAANGATVRDENGTPVTSIGLEVHYAAVDSQNIEGRTSDNRLIFTLHVNTDGTFTFTLNDQIDHPTHTHDNGQGFGEETLNLDISNAIIAHDATPDPIVFPTNTIEIGVIDDTPIAFDSAPFYPQPDVEGSGSFSSALDDEDQSHGIQNGPGDNGFGTSVSGILEILPGADNYGSVSFAAGVSVTATDGVNTTSISQLQAIWVDGSGFGHKEDVTLTWVADGSGGGTLTGSTSHLANAFTLTVDKFGDYTFSANAPLAHPFTADPGNPGSSEFEDNLSLVFTYTATDGDGDQVDAHLTINVDDDVPSLFLNAYGSGTVVIHDETPGVQSANGATDVTGGTAITFNGSSTTVSALFNSVVNKGSDPDVSHDHGAIGFAQGLNGLASVVANFGADGAALTQSEAFSFLLPKGNGTFSGLYTTEGERIYLFNENGIIVGRIDADHDLAEDSQPGHFNQFDLHDPDDAAAFAITIDPATGKVYVAQYLSLEHFSSPDAGGDISEADTLLGSGTLLVSVTLTDGDGDSVTKTADVGPEIKFLDDGPKVGVKVDHDFSVILDEQPGVQSGEDDDTGSSTVRHLFDNVPNPKGFDLDLNGPPDQHDHGAINFAISDDAALDFTTLNFGADGPKLDNHGHPDGIAYSLTLNGVSGQVDSGLTTTDNHKIFLFLQNGYIVGRVDTNDDGHASTSDPAAFAITIDDNGHVATALWLSLHGNNPNAIDDHDIVHLASGTIGATATITDGDGDTASASADISAKVAFEDDGPSLDAKLKHDVNIIHDETPGNDPSSNDVSGSTVFNGGTVASAFSGVSLPVGDDPDVPPATGPIGYALSNGSIIDVTSVNFGADGPAAPHGLAYSFVLSSNTSGGIHSGLTTTDGRDIHLFKEGNLIVGRYEIGGDNIPDGSNDEPAAFAISIDPVTGQIAVVQYVSLHHPDSTNPNDVIDLNDNILFVQVTATDGDGDHVSDKVDIGTAIEFRDDAPSASSVTVNELDVTVDETPGVQTAVDPFPANDVLDTGLSTAIKNLFDAIGSARGVDGDVAPGTLDDGALSFAASTGSLLSIGAVNFGADGPFGGSAATGTTLSLKVTDGTYSGVQTTDGHDVFLYAGKGALSGLILGRVGTEASPTPGLDTKDPNGTVAFALTTDASGKVYIADYLPLLNPTAGSTPAAYNDQIQLASGTVQAVVTLKDGDGDTVSSSGTDISSHIRFQDDGPSVLGVNDGTGPNLVNNGSFEQGHIDLVGTDWSIYSSLPNPPGNPWTYGADHIPFEVQIGEPGGLAAQDGIALVELDGDTTGNGHAGQATPDPVHTDATIQQVIAGTVAGQEYELTFYYSPRPGDSANNDSGLRVLWNGVEIDNIDSTNLPSGWTQITLHVIGTGNDTLAFQGTGPEDEFGAFIDNVSLHAVTILDDEDTTLNPAIEVQGGPGDDGHGVVATGQILFNAGADGLKSIVVNGIGGLQAIFVDVNGVGHPESVTQTWVADGSGGGTLIGTSAHFFTGNPVFTLVVDNTGHYTFTLNAPLNHPLTDDPSTGAVETSFEDNLNLGFGFTVTDGDNDTATGTLHINVDDDSPEFFFNSATQTLGIEDATVTQLNVGVTKNLNLHFGADGEHDGNSGLQITGWPDLAGVTETLSADGKTLTATLDNGPGAGDDQPLYVLHLNFDGTYTFTQQHGLPGNGIDHLSFNVTGMDGDGDSVSDAFVVKLDVAPPLSVSANFSGTVEEEQLGHTGSGTLFPASFTGNEDTDTHGAPVDNDQDTGVNFNVTTNIVLGQYVVGGGALPLNFFFASGIEGTQAHFTDASAVMSHGAPVFYHLNGNTLIGYVDSGSNAGNFDATDRVIFTFQITDTVNGNGTFTLYDNIDHTPGDNVEGTQSLSLNGLVEVRDSSSPAQELALNGSVDIIDDVPTISTGPSSAWLTVDESFLTTDATTSFAAAFIPLFGADGPAANGSKVYALNAIAGASGLVDTATGEAVDLSVVGGVVFGKTHTTGLTVFTVSVDGSGNVTLDQQRAIVHPDTGDPNDSKTLSAANLVTLTETITDGDGDHASATLNIGQSLTFKDDGPSIIASGTVPTLTVDETFLATDASAGFAASFVSSFGADGAGSIAYALGVSSSGADSGLVDTASGNHVFLFVEGSQVVGREGTSAGVAQGVGPIVFTVSVDGSGNVTLDQQRAIVHTPDTGPDQSKSLTADNLVTLTATITDKDGDHTSATQDIGTHLVFKDDAPTAVADTASVTPTDVAATVNAFFILDKSGSMGSDGNPASSISIAKAAILDFASHSNVLSIQVLLFDSQGQGHSGWFDLTDHTPVTGGFDKLVAYLDPVTGAGNTNYEDAIFDTQAAWTAPPTTADFTNVYFVSDGAPTVRSNEGSDNGNVGGSGDPNGLTVQEKAGWEAFLANPANHIDNAFAIGINTGVSNIDLQEVAYPNTPDETHNVFIINSADDLATTLTNTLEGSVSGNVLLGTNNAVGGGDDDSFGADGPGYVSSLHFDSNGTGGLTVGDSTYTFNGSHLFLDGVDQGALNQVTFNTGHGGEMHFNFLTGAWTYSTPDSVPAQFHELFQYTLVDGDGDATPPTGLDITVNKANEPPSITSGATGAEDENTVNTHVVYQTVAADPDVDTLAYSLTGADASKFAISGAGAVTFLTSPDHETPTDAGVNNVYNITVHVNDGHGHDVTKDVAITVNDLNDVAPTFTSGGAGSEAENTAASNVVYDANVTDPDTVGTIAYFLTGADASAFNINSGNGQVTFKVSPDHEAPTDAGGNNVYDITVHASDGIHDTTQAVAITVTNVNEAPVAVADHVISNFAGGAYTVPEWALLFNDGDPEGNAIDVNSVTNGSGNMGLSHTAGAGTNGTINIDDNGGGSDGNTFTYTATDGSLVGNSATVTVDNKSAGSNLTGTANDDILVGDSGGSTFTGNGGNDVIIAGGGNDTLMREDCDRRWHRRGTSFRRRGRRSLPLQCDERGDGSHHLDFSA